MKIYWIRAQAPRRVTALVKHLGLDAQFIEADLMAGDLKTKEYAALNPNKKAPTLVDGDFVLWESAAIMAHLAIKAGSDMWPANDPAAQVEVLRWLSWSDLHWDPPVSSYYFEHVVKKTFSLGAPDPAPMEEARENLLKYAAVLDAHLDGKDHPACGRLTIADFQLASMASYWREAEMPFETFPNLVRWLDRLDRIPAWADPWPDGGRKAA